MTATSELLKTGGFLLAAAVLLTVAVWMNRPLTAGIGVSTAQVGINEPLFTFKPEEATGLEIVRFDPETSQVDTLRVERQGRLWVLPSHENYPADAESQLGDAAREIRSIRRGSEVATSRDQHEQFGVIDPNDAKPGSTGIGTRIVVEQGDRKVAELIVGNAEGDGSQRFVRLAGQEPVYRASVDVERFPTDFREWIEKDLLKIEGLSLKRIRYENFEIDRESYLAGRNPIKSFDMLRLNYDRDKPLDERWTIEELVRVDSDDSDEATFEAIDLEAVGKEINTEALDALTQALEDLPITDVRRKPQDLILALQGRSDGVTRETMMDLINKGFFHFGQFVGQQGNLVVSRADGVEYTLHFGDEVQDAATGQTRGRYLFISAGFNPTLISPPELTPVPTSDGPPEYTDESPMPPEPGATAQAGPMMSEEELAATREAIEARNARRQAEYEEKLADGRKLAEELNSRFVDWYYVVPADEYDKIHLTRADLLTAGDAERAADLPDADDFSPSAFDRLRQPLDFDALMELQREEEAPEGQIPPELLQGNPFE